MHVTWSLITAAEQSGPDNGATLLAVVAGGAITFATATIGQLLGERFRRNADKRKVSRDRAQARRDHERSLLDALLDAEKALAAALDRDRAIDLERAHDPQAKEIRDADAAFRALVPQVDDDRVRERARAWRDVARGYAATRDGEPGGPRLTELDAAQDALHEAVGKVVRRLNREG